MKLWECPECGATNKMSLAICFCGYEAKGNERETTGQQQVKVVSWTDEDVIRVKEKAEIEIYTSAYILYFFAGLYIVGGVIVLGDVSIMVGITLALLTVILHISKSRIVSVIIFIFYPLLGLIDAIILTIQNGFPIRPLQIILSVILLKISFNAVMATFEFRRTKTNVPTPEK